MNSVHERSRIGALGWLLGLGLLLGFAPPTAARTWHIQNDGSGDAPTVQAGIDSAAVRDTVLVGPGTYLENLSIVGKDLVLKSEMGPEVTILDGSSQQETVIFLDGLTRDTVVEGFSITGGSGHLRGSGRDGGGLFLGVASAVIRNNRVLSNNARYGAGVAVTNAQAFPTFESNLFSGNQAYLGGGLQIGPALVRGNVFRNNSCQTDGGAIYAVFNSGFVTIEGNQFWDNYAGDHGGALHIGGTSSSEVRIASNLFVRNEALGLDTGDTGSGGAMHVSGVRGSVVSNTLVEGIGPSGQTRCGGGGISLEYTSPNLIISDNIIALNSNCGIACRFSIANTLGQNLFWMNQNADLGFGFGECPSEWAANQIFADPMFCGPEVGNYTVSIDSPALTGPVPMGVWTTPGCGPGVPVQPTTWGRLKSLYR